MTIIALWSAPGPFTLANGTDARLQQLEIRVSDGHEAAWRTLRPDTLAPGARGAIAGPPEQTCAFDIRATVKGTPTTWSSVNLCDVKTVTLHRRPDGTLWVDYD